MKVHPDTIKSQLTKEQWLAPGDDKPYPVTSTVYPLVDKRGKPLKIGDEVAVSKEKVELSYHKIKEVLEQEMIVRESIPQQLTSPSGYTYTSYVSKVFPTDVVTYILVLDSKMSIKRKPEEVLLLA